MFNFKKHFDIYKDHLFFDEHTYADLLQKSSYFLELYSTDSSKTIALKFKSPYLMFAALIASLFAGKLAVLLSPLETDESLERLRFQIKFKRIYSDGDFTSTSAGDFDFEQVRLDIPAMVVFSSGSTNLPKGIALTFLNLFYSAKGFAEYFNQTSKDVSLMNLPHHHVAGLMTMWRAFFTGGSLISSTTKKYDFISVVPLQLSRNLVDEKSLAQLKECRVILVGGSRLSEELKDAAEKAGLKLYETYGMSESTSLVCINGEVLPYREVSLNNEDYILIKGNILSPGYFKENQFYPLEKDNEGWFKTNDIGLLTGDGKYKFSHRADLVFISGGENINPLFIEEILRQHPKIRDVYVVPVEDERWGEMGVALYDSEGNVSEEELRSFLKTKLHPHHVPKKFFQMALKFEGQLKPKRNDLIKIASEHYLKSIFSFSHIKKKDTSSLIVFFHGFTGSKEDFYPLGDKFLETHSLLYIDLPGHGRTLSDNFFSTTDVLKKLSNFIKLFSEHPVLYGYSMGGRLALQLALHYLTPESLILESAGPGLNSETELKDRREKDLMMFDEFKKADSFLKEWYKNALFKNYRESESFNSDLEKKSAHNLDEWKKSQRTLSQGCFPLLEVNLKAINKASFPICYLYGSEDLKYKAYATLFTNSHEIAGASHNPHKTHLPEITEILRLILK